MIDKIEAYKQIKGLINAPTEKYILNKIRDVINNEAGYEAMKVEYKDKVTISLYLDDELITAEFNSARQAILTIGDFLNA